MGISAISRSQFVEKPEIIHYETNNSEEDLHVTLVQAVNGQVNKSIRRMPWHWEPKKDVISCEKLR